MYFVYILRSLRFQNQYYTGFTNDLEKRLQQHNTGLTESTKRYLPWEFVYYEGYANKEDAVDREQKLKQFGRVYSQLKRRIKMSLESTGKVRG